MMRRRSSPGKGSAAIEVDRNANALFALTLIRAYSDAAHQNEPAYGDRVAGTLLSVFRTAGGCRSALASCVYHAEPWRMLQCTIRARARESSVPILESRALSPPITSRRSRAIVRWSGK